MTILLTFICKWVDVFKGIAWFETSKNRYFFRYTIWKNTSWNLRKIQLWVKKVKKWTIPLIFHFFSSCYFSPTWHLIFHFWKKKRNRSIFVRFQNKWYLIVWKNIRNTRICPKNFFWIHQVRGGSLPDEVRWSFIFFVNKSMTRGSPLLTWWMIFFWTYTCVPDVLPNNLVAFIPKSEKNWTISFFSQTLRNPSFLPFYLPFSLFRIGLK